MFTAVFLEVMSSCEALLSSSLGLQLDNLDEPIVLLVSFPKFNDNFGFLPAIGVPDVLDEGEGAFKAVRSVEVGMQSDSLVGAGRV